MRATAVDIDIVAWMMRLAMGRAGPAIEALHPTDWGKILDVSVRERCAATTWVNGGPAIRRHAPVQVVERWRGHYARSTQWCLGQLAAIAPSTETLAQRGIFPIVLKGIPLSVQIYGDPGARSPADIDWFVRHQDRGIVRTVLLSHGWSVFGAEGEAEASFRRQLDGEWLHLEVHSTLFHPRFAYLRVPEPTGADVRIEGVSLRAHAGPSVPAYLAVHLATHHFAPLGWFVDFALLWASLNDRRSAIEAARAVGVYGFLAWAGARARALEAVCDGDLRALRTLGMRRTGRIDPHPMWRHLKLVPAHRAPQAVLAWVLPSWARGGNRPFLSFAERVTHYWKAALTRHTPARRKLSQEPSRLRTPPRRVRPSADERLVTLNSGQVLATSREIVAHGGEFWFRISGVSMQPTLAPGDEVLLTPAGSAVRRGDIVLASVNGRPLIHRVSDLHGDQVHTRGDATERNDRCRADEVIARAIAASRPAGLTALVPTLRFGAKALLRYGRSQGRLAWARWRRRGYSL